MILPEKYRFEFLKKEICWVRKQYWFELYDLLIEHHCSALQKLRSNNWAGYLLVSPARNKFNNGRYGTPILALFCSVLKSFEHKFAAEKLQAAPTPWSNWLDDLEATHVLSHKSLTSVLNWNANHKIGFLCVFQLLYGLHSWPTKSNQSQSQTKVEIWLKTWNMGAPAWFKAETAKVLHCFKRIMQEPNLNMVFRNITAPLTLVELVFIGELSMFVIMQTLSKSLQTTCHNIQAFWLVNSLMPASTLLHMKLKISTHMFAAFTHIQVNSRVNATFWHSSWKQNAVLWKISQNSGLKKGQNLREARGKWRWIKVPWRHQHPEKGLSSGMEIGYNLLSKTWSFASVQAVGYCWW